MFETKLKYFEYIIHCLSEWYKEENGLITDKDFSNNNDFSKLKVIKLHFFVVAVNAHKNNLLHIFNKFVAMPLGHVESDVYSTLAFTQLFKFTHRNCQIVGSLPTLLDSLEEHVKSEIETAVDLLKELDPHFVSLTASELVDKSHSLVSWQFIYNTALERGKRSDQIPDNILLEESKYFDFMF